MEGRFMTYRTRITLLSLAIIFNLTFAAHASEVTIPHQFTDGSAAVASQVNENFSAVKTAVDDNHLQLEGKLPVEGGTITGDLIVDGSLTFSQPKTGSVTYSAIGFTSGDPDTGFIKDGSDGSLSYPSQLGPNDGTFYHSLTLRSGITITNIRAHVRDNNPAVGVILTVNLKKKALGQKTDTLATASTESFPSNQTNEQIITPESMQPAAIEEPPTSYFIEVIFSGQNLYLYSVTIDYEYTEP